MNEIHGTKLSTVTIGQYVCEGKFGVSPIKQGPAGDFTRNEIIALECAFATFVLLEYPEGEKKSTKNELGLVVNACVSTHPEICKTGHHLVNKLQKSTACFFDDVMKQNMVEQQRVLWTTYQSLCHWVGCIGESIDPVGICMQVEPIK